MELSGDMPIQLVIKAPNQRMADQTVDCMLGWTIKKLKQHLEAVYPSKPKHTEQRLIYSGKLLQDHLTLKEILRQYDSVALNKHTVHLVCSAGTEASPSTSDSLSSKNMSQARMLSGDQHSSHEKFNVENINANQTDGLRHRGHGHSPESSNSQGPASGYSLPQTDSLQGISASYPGYQYSPEQYAWMMQQQQMYSQYMMNYMNYYSSLFSEQQSFNMLTSPSQILQQQVDANAPPQQLPAAQQNAPANNAAQGAAGRPNVRMNAQGGMEDDDEEEEPRDWLHHAYFFMRVLTFLAILFFYSNMTRFIVVFIGSFIFYFLQRFRNHPQRHNQEQAQQEQAQVEQQQQPEQPEVIREEGQEAVPPTEPTTHNNNEQQPTAEDNGGRTTRICIFIYNTIQTFFTSLLPAPPELLQAN